MFWDIFINSVVLIIGIVVLGQIVAKILASRGD